MELRYSNQFEREVGAAEGGPSWWKASLDGHVEGHQSLALQRAGACRQGAETQMSWGWMSPSYGRILHEERHGRASPKEDHFGCMAEGAGREGRKAAVPLSNNSSHTPIRTS